MIYPNYYTTELHDWQYSIILKINAEQGLNIDMGWSDHYQGYIIYHMYLDQSRKVLYELDQKVKNNFNMTVLSLKNLLDQLHKKAFNGE